MKIKLAKTVADRALRLAFCAAGWLLVSAASLDAAVAHAAEPVMRIGVLKFGTVTWELAVIAHHGLDRTEGIRIESVELASTPATQVALQGGRVDAIVTDFVWVSRQRAEGADWTFVPFSTAVGSVVVPAGSPIHGMADLKGRRLGVAGSPLDKGWLILRALARQRYGFDPDQATVKLFGAPPLLDEQLLAGRIEALLTYWQFVARLEVRGMRRLISVEDALHDLGIAAGVPLIGYVVSDRWVRDNRTLLDAFLRTSRRAKHILAASDAEWRRIAELTQARDPAELAALRDAFRAGIPQRWGEAERADAARLVELLAAIAGKALVGRWPTLQTGTFLETVRY